MKDFTIFQDMLLLLPLRDSLLRSITIFPGKYEKNHVSIICSYNPLYSFHDHFYMVFSKTLKQINSETNFVSDEWSLEKEHEIVLAIESQAIPFLSIASDARSFSDKASTLKYRSYGGEAEESVICSLAKCGRRSEAIFKIELLKLQYFFYSSKEALKHRLNLLEASLLKGEEVDRILDNWTKESIKNMELSGIEKFFSN